MLISCVQVVAGLLVVRKESQRILSLALACNWIAGAKNTRAREETQEANANPQNKLLPVVFLPSQSVTPDREPVTAGTELGERKKQTCVSSSF